MAQDWFDQATGGSTGAAPVGGGGMIQTRPADPKLPGQVQGQNLGNARDASTLPYAGPQAGANLAKTQQEIDDRDYRRGDTLRGDFDGQKDVQNYRTTIPIFLSGLKAQPNATGDLQLMNSYSKVVDPSSVVREGEVTQAGNTDTFFNQLVAKLKKQGEIDGGGNLSPTARERLKNEMNTRVAQLAKAYGVQRSRFQETAKRQGVNPEDVVGGFPVSPVQIAEYKAIMGDRLKDQSSAIASGADGNGPTQVDPTGGNPLLSPGDREYLSRNAKTKGRAWVEQYLADRKLRLPAKELDDAYGYWANGGQQDPVVNAPQGDGNMVGAALATPLGTGAASYLNSAAFGVPQLLTGDAPFEALQRENPKATIAGDMAGGLTGTLLGGAGLLKTGMSIPRAGLAANLGYGTAFGANTNEGNRLAGGAIGLGAAAAGEGVGRYALSPLVDAALRSAPGKAATRMFGRAVPRRLDAPESSLASDIMPEAGDIRATLADAERLNLPMSLADASPTARQTLGAATRLDPTVRTNIGGQLENRAAERNTRALTGLSGLSEPVDMRATTGEIFKAAQEAASPFYQRAYAQPAIVTPEVSSLLQRPSLQQAMGKARGTIAEQGGSPTTMGFSLDAANNPVLNPIPTNQLAEHGAAQTALKEAQDALLRGNASLAGNVDRKGLQAAVDAAQERLARAQVAMSDAPSVGSLAETPSYNWKALDYTKRGLDDVLEDLRDPITRRLPKDRNTQAIQNTRVDYRNALGRINDDYRQGLDAYSGIARRNDDLNAGFSAADSGTNMPDFNLSMSNVEPDNIDYFRRGYVSNLNDTVRSRRDGSNAYELIAGTQDQRDKLGRLFPNADDFLRQRELERMMGATNQEVLGGPATAGRMAANERFQGPDLGNIAEIGLSMATGVPPVGAITNGARSAAKGMFGRRSQQMTQDAARNLAPKLAEQNPVAATSSLDSLLSDYDAITRYNSLLKAGSSAITAPALSSYAAYRF